MNISPTPNITVIPVAGFQAYLWRDDDYAVLIDGGPVGSLAELVEGLDAAGATPDDLN